ncbi:MAG: glycosyltransferase family 9 protein [Candidatus Eremiobacteraeota bacterium]|nr:glycosyltransferase family 9 protein [Candidatus Eremiobacteraeota bacterium]
MRALLYCAGGGIGDSLVASVVARALRERFAAVDALTLAGHRATLERVPDVDDVLTDDGEPERALADALALRDYEACVVTWATSRTARIPQLARIPVRVGQARRLYSFRFTKPVTIRSEIGDVTSHWSDILLDYARAIGCDTDDRSYRFEPTADDESEAQRALDSLGDSQEGFIILNPCNAIASKRGQWPVEGWVKVALALHERFGSRILVAGSPADAPIAGAIVTGTVAQTGPDAAVSVAGKLGIGAFGALARRTRAFVGITTGSMHVAAAVGCPTVGIFPFQTDFPDRWGPMGRCVAVVRPSYPCHRGDTKETCADYACVAQLDVPRIVSAAESLT